MRRFGCLTFIGCNVGLLFCAVAWAQQPTPRIGYVYPAGGQVGATFQVVVGGQYLEGVNKVHFSGDGAEAAVVDFNKPMNQGQFNLLRDQLKELQEKKAAALKSNRRRAAEASTNEWTAADEQTMTEIRAKMLKNPPNRNATVAIAETATLKVVLASNAAPGEMEVRLGTPTGLSNPLKFRIGQLTEFSEPAAKAPNPDADRFRERFGRAQPKARSAEPPMRVTLPATVNGQIMPGEVDRFRFSARQGQQLVVAVSARELIPYLADAVPGWFQATLTLFDSRSKEVAYTDDFQFHPDPLLFYKIPADGDYTIEIKDAIYRGREDFVYRIALGELPFVTSIFPLGSRIGSKTLVELKGWNLPVNRLTPEFQEEGPSIRQVSLPQGGFEGSSVPFAVDTLPERTEVESNNLPGNAEQIAVPVIVNGRIGEPGDQDVFRFEGRAGDTIVAEVRARRLNSPLDSLLRLTDASGRQIAANDDHEDKGSGLNTHHADSYLRVVLPATGAYYVHLGDTQRKGGADYGYRLRISPPQPGFALRVVPSSITVRGGMSAPLTVYALRRDGFSNEIALALTDPPPGFALSGARVPANQDQVRLTLTAPSSASAGPVTLNVEGRARIGGQEVVRSAVPAEDMMQAFAYRHLVPAQELQVSVAGRGGQRGAVRILSPTPVRIPVGGTARVTVGMPVAAAAGKLHLELDGAPEGLTIQEVLPAGKATEIVFASDAAKTKPGTQGNLIVAAFVTREPGKEKAPSRRRAPVGMLPAIPFEVRQK